MADSFRKFSFFDDFEIPEITHEAIKSNLVKIGRVAAVKKVTSVDDMPLLERLKYITEETNKTLGRYKGFIKVIYGEEEASRYIDKAIKCGYLSFDTETNRSLDPLTCKLMGLCCYIPNTRPVYIPMNHVNPETKIRLPNQLDEDGARRLFQRLKDSNIKMIYHNGKFDIRVCYNVTGVYLPIWWDTMIASQLLDENEQAKLKVQYRTKVDPTIDSYNIEKLFGLPYEYVDPEVFGLYAAIDSYDTWKLQQVQLKEFEKEGMDRLFNLFQSVEVPVIQVCAEMEDTGIAMDLSFLDKLNTKYHDALSKARAKLDTIVEPYSRLIEVEQLAGHLDTPVNYDSPSQLSLLMYDILKIAKPVQGEKGMGKPTDADTLRNLRTEFSDTLLEYRHYDKLIKAFTEALPKLLSTRDGRLHADFNQMGREERGVRTGRFSSTNPNLQQIPSKEKSMRLAFKASEGCCIVGGDFSAQEPRLLAHLANESKLRETFELGRDPYATIASFVFKRDYWECMEHHEDGTPNPEGASVRKRAKSILLGMTYGMGAKLLAEKLGTSIDECRNILEEFYRMFPDIKVFADGNERSARELGYVEDYFGRRRHLPDASLKPIEIKPTNTVLTEADVFMDDIPLKGLSVKVVDQAEVLRWQKVVANLADRFDGRRRLRELLKDAGDSVSYKDNSGFISKTLTQCTNARIQGSAATLTKKAMVAIRNDPVMQKLGFKILIPIHDELLGECPVENAEKAEKRLAELMIAAAKPECTVAMKVDTYRVKHWYADEVSNAVYEAYQKGADDSTKALLYLQNKYSEIDPAIIEKMCLGVYDEAADGI